MRPPVFVSYSEADRSCAFGLVERVEASGVRCWIAPRDIAPASDWAAEIVDAIGAAAVMVLVFSASSNDSPQVRREVERAVHKRVRVLPFRIENVLPSKSLEYFLSSQHWLDAFPPPLEPHYRALCERLASLLAPNANASARARGEAAPENARPPVAFDPEFLRRIERELASYIGPVARHLVQRAVGVADGPDGLIVRLEGELEEARDREAFASACRRLVPSNG